MKATNLPLIAVISLLSGMGVGWFGSSLFSEPETLEPQLIDIDVQEFELTDEQLAELCKELTEEEKQNVFDIQEKVTSLQSSLAEKEEELSRLRAKEKGNKERRIEAQKRWKELEADIATLRVQLASAEQERDELREELKETIVKLDKQIKETKKFKSKAKKYRRESTQNLWTAFVNEAKVKGCNRGSKRRHDKCWTAFEAGLTGVMQERFTTCVNTYQAVPILRKVENGAALPSFAEWLPQDDRFTKNWYVIFCDPSLPEKRDVDLDAPDPPSNSELPSSRSIDKTSEPSFDDLNFDLLPEE